MKKILLTLLLSSYALSFSIQDEVRELNNKFNNYAKYPIIVFDKKEVISKIRGKSKQDQFQVLKDYVKDHSGVEISDFEADTILSYHTLMNSSASALPFRDGFDGDYKFCAVFPSGVESDHDAEVERILGANATPSIYPEGSIESVKKLMSLKELKLYSLYHELSHCLDPYFIPQSRRAGHDIHQAESFAEVLALFLLSEKERFKSLGLRRSFQRTLYTKYMGKYLATTDDIIVFDETMRQGGIIYYLSPVLLRANQQLNDYDFRMKKKTLEDYIQVSYEIVNHHALSGRQFAALSLYLKDGKEQILKQYLNMMLSAPDLFYDTYLGLQFHISVIEDIDLVLE